MSSPGLFDFHVHGGDIGRTGEIADYIRLENLSGLNLLSIPLTGFPAYVGKLVNLNDAVLETKRRLNNDPDVSVPVYAFGSLDNRQAPGGGWDPAAQVAGLAETGFDGLKLWEGKPEIAAALNLMPDDPGIIEACREAGRREMPVIFHVADPPEFWEPEVGELSLFGKSVPAFKELVQGAARLCAKAPDTTIVFPHLLFLAADLPGAGAFLDQSPNACFDLAPGNYFYLPLSDNLSSARDFFSRYRKRILFGSDAFFFSDKQAPIPGDSLKGNRRRCHRLLNFLQKGAGEEDTEDNPYPLTRDIRSSVRCLNLPEDLQESILSGNALRILPDTPAEVHR